MQHLALARPLLFVPAAIAAAYVLRIFESSPGVVLEAVPRAIGGTVLAVVAVQLVISLLLRSAARGAIATALIAVVVLDPRAGVVSLGIAAVVGYHKLRLRQDVPSQPLVIATVALLAITIVQALSSPAFRVDDLVRPAPAAAAPPTSDHPDIFLILLDAYPRSDTLAEWGYDNTWFEEELAARGFDVAPESHSNYAATSLVVPSMLHMRHIVDIPALDPSLASAGQHRAIRDAVLENPALDRLEALGYTTVSAGMPGWPVTLKSADRYVDGGQVTFFEHRVLAHTLLGSSLPILREQHRDRVLSALDAAAATAAEPSSTFMLAHVLSPHMPPVFDRAGELPSIPCNWTCNPFATAQWETGIDADSFYRVFLDQVHGLNGLVLDTIDGITEQSPEAIVVVFSDHGLRSEPGDREEHFATFFAARTPGEAGLFPEDARAVEVFPRLFNAYFGDEHPIPEDRTFHGPEAVWLPLVLEEFK